jgi:biopolymer transport protein ExbB/TolQ
MNSCFLILIVILLLVNVLFSESFTSGSNNSVRKLAYSRASVDSYINEARLLLSNVSDVEVMKVALLLSVKDNESMEKRKDNEKAMALMEKQKDNEKESMEKQKDNDNALSIIENYYLKKLSILSLRYHHTYYLLTN